MMVETVWRVKRILGHRALEAFLQGLESGAPWTVRYIFGSSPSAYTVVMTRLRKVRG